jgi:hypothetical protein
VAGKRFGSPPNKGPDSQGIKIDYFKNGKMSVVSKAKVKELHNKIKNKTAIDTAKKIIKSKKYSEVNRAVNPKSKTTSKNETVRTLSTDKSIYPSIYGNKKNLTKYPVSRDKYQSYSFEYLEKKAKDKKNLIDIPSTAQTYVSAEDVSKALSEEIDKSRKLPEGMKIGALSNIGCPHRENGVKSDIKGISNIQVKGKKFIGVK